MDSARTAPGTPGADAIAGNGTGANFAGSGAQPTGRQFALESGGYRAVVTEVGAGLRELEHLGPQGPRPLIHGFAADQAAQGGAGQLLAPWPNRVAGGRYRFDGQERQLDITEPARGNAIHGLVRWAGWRVEEESPGRVVLSHRLYPHPGYPHILDLTAAYSLSDTGLEVEVTAHNIGREAAPYGYAAHPYLLPGVPPQPDAADQWTLHVPAQNRVEVDERMNPIALVDVDGSGYDFRTARQLGGCVLDTAFGGLQRELDGIARVRLSEPGGNCVTLWMDHGLEWIQVFTADPLSGPRHRAAVAVEPMSCPPDAFNSGTDLIRLEPGVTVGHRWGIHAG
ncbi:aldose 1-epimerase family protein [Actinocrinis puniceicyclus]|uniref:Aldose 1-epimerase family protein n=1 Tax=Actinocrinis puniceicyclus TaxID=977794 RepID=A0A8J7WMR9_9ACTN|nr:aldose 1-epimerase family protein [Actinocrinis puniceicyclus]MBS2963012.1 aldose 1-epimerase family protein [Actinocrinis puniceicyclus]